MFLPILCCATCLIFIIVTFMYYFGMTRKRKREKRNELDSILAEGIPTDIQKAARILVERKYDYIRNYIIFQLANKVFGLASVIFSVLGLLSQSMEITPYIGLNYWLPYFISFFSIVFVIIALYLSPTSRVHQYITAWKECDDMVSKTIANQSSYIAIRSQLSLAENSKNQERIQEIQSQIADVAEDIVSVIHEAEISLTTDSE